MAFDAAAIFAISNDGPASDVSYSSHWMISLYTDDCKLAPKLCRNARNCPSRRQVVFLIIPSAHSWVSSSSLREKSEQWQ
jgi:hypothetical protein